MTKTEKIKQTNGFIPSVKTLTKSIREYKRPSILAPLFVAMEVIIECLIPYVMTLLLGAIEYVYALTENNVLENPNPISVKIVKWLFGNSQPVLLNTILYFGLGLLILAFLSLTFGALSGRCCAVASSGFAKNLRKDMYYKVQDFSFSNIDKFSSSSLITRMTTDVMHVEMSYMMIIRTAVRSPFMLIFSMVMAFTINSQMALIFLCTTPILAIGLILIMTKAVPFFNRIFKKYDKMNESVEENISGMRVVKSYVREDFEKEKFDKASKNVRDDFIKAERIIAFNGPLMNFCVYSGLIAIYVFGSLMIIKSNQQLLKITELQSFMTYSFQMLMSLMILSMIMVQLVMSTASIKRIAEVINEKPSIISPENAITEVTDGSINFNNVCFKYSENAERYALSNINLNIKSGETVGIIGSTGSSKTSLVQLIPRLYDVSEGELTVAGVNVKNYDLDSLRNAVAMVLQKNVLFSGTIKDNMRWGNKNATDEEIIEACKLAQADEFIQNFPEKYDHYIEQGGVNVSGGQKQRLCIARALLKKPKILILDDSTSAVDTKTDALIRKAFREFIPETTKIIIAQRIASVEDADKIIIMDGGSISAVGTHEELLKCNNIYQELYKSQNKVESNKQEKGGDFNG
ncbi:MAG: ABC transporter ATP-binding protein [Clostridia bacterium]|nr:ABC transporter ATP-binding protein [Clostridia bacterium]